MLNPHSRQWLFLTSGKLPKKFFRKGRPLLQRHTRWRKTALLLELSREARAHLEWIIYYELSNFDAALTIRRFGLTGKTFYKWLNRFDPNNLRSLEEHSRAPRKRRTKEYTPLQYERVIELRRQYIRYGKIKLLHYYQKLYPADETISSWKIQCIIERAGIYYNPKKQARVNRKRQLSVKRKKITDLKQQRRKGFLLCLDTVVIYWKSKKRYVITGIDKYAKVAFARMYTSPSSTSSRDFLYRLYYLLDGKIDNIQTDNGSEFKGRFDQACQKLSLEHYWSRVKTPKDNAVNERFNRTVQDEFIALGNMTDNVRLFNQRLTEWLVEYNFRRPHQTLGYMPPINFTYKYHKLLPMYPSSTWS
jgi:transposase InsO family protein